jgi:hypothetical protein
MLAAIHSYLSIKCTILRKYLETTLLKSSGLRLKSAMRTFAKIRQGSLGLAIGEPFSM